MACYLPHPAPGVNWSQQKSFREPLKKKFLLVTWDWELLRGVLPIQIARLLKKSRRVGNRRSLALPGPGIRNNIFCCWFSIGGWCGRATSLCVHQRGLLNCSCPWEQWLKALQAALECKAVIGQTEIASGRGEMWFLAAGWREGIFYILKL